MGYSEKQENVVTFREDRIVDLEIMNDDIVLEPVGFNIADYATTIIEMFDGEPQEVKLVCDNELMKSVIDKFVENIKTKCISDVQFQATVSVSTSKTFYAWCFQFAGQMKIVGPKKVKEEYQEMEKDYL